MDLVTDLQSIEYSFDHGNWKGSFETRFIVTYETIARHADKMDSEDWYFMTRETIHEYLYEMACSSLHDQGMIFYDDDGFMKDESDEAIDDEYEFLTSDGIVYVFSDIFKLWKACRFFVIEIDFYTGEQRKIHNPPLKGVW